jgi:uncharacterized membrane protein
MVAAYAAYFSWYTIQRHSTLNSYAADLSLIDQPMWNTVRGPGAFMELTWGDRQQPRLAEHFEPVLVPLALLFYVWDDVRILLVVQSVALALGAVPVFWIARQQFAGLGPALFASCPSLPAWAALAFAGAYLLYPQLQAANVADFHADPFVVTPLLLAFWYARQQRWRWMWGWAIVAMATKETLPPLMAMLGLWLALDRSRSPGRRPVVVHGLALMAVSTAWFLVATFGIVAPLAQQFFGTAGPIYFANRYDQGLAGLAALLQDPARWRYLFGLLAAAGFLPLLAPDLLLLGLPVLAANLLSNFAGQYSGEQHYSAPLVPALILAAIFASRRLAARLPAGFSRGDQPLKLTALVGLSLWLLVWSLGYQARYGWTPLSTRVENYRMTPAAARLPELAARVPDGVPVSASAAIHPHLAHRRAIYVFPTVATADFLLVDVTDIPGVHPHDARARILELLQSGWQVLAADQGLLLAQKQPGAAGPKAELPDSFFDFARARTKPMYQAQVDFGNGRLYLLGYDLADDPDNGVSFRFYWQSSGSLPENLRLWPLVYDDLGRLLIDPTQAPLVAALWYPPSAWRPGEVVVTETLPQRLPDVFHLGLAAGPDDGFGDTARRYLIDPGASEGIWLHPVGRWLQLASFQRKGPVLKHLPARPTLRKLAPMEASFGQTLRLTGYWIEQVRLTSGSALPILLEWTAERPPQRDLTVFIHLLAPDGRLVAQSDATPTWLTPAPSSQWPAGQSLLDQHTVLLPADLPPGSYTLALGLYDSDTLDRLPLPDGQDSLSLGQIQVE